jgi:transcriptional regulator with PAS, ATPase and Fis domain
MVLHKQLLHAAQGEERANTKSDELSDELKETPVEQLRQERVAHAITRANAEQARRIADCTRASWETLLLHLDQPCAVVDRNGTVTQWNDGLAEFSGIGAQQAVGQNLQTLLRLSSTHKLARALCALTPATTYKPQTPTTRVLTSPLSLLPEVTAAQITLVPLCRVPGSLEAIIILIRPA